MTLEIRLADFAEPSAADLFNLQKAAARRGGILAGEIVDFSIDGGREFSAHAFRDDWGYQGISLLIADTDDGTLLDSAGRLITSSGALGFAGLMRIDDTRFNRARLLHVIGAYYGERLAERAGKRCHTDKALRALLDPTSKEDRLELGFERPRAYKSGARHLEDSVTHLIRRAVSPVVWSAFDSFPLGDDDEDHDGQDRLARAFGIDIWKWDETATLARMRGLWKLISDDPFPRS